MQAPLCACKRFRAVFNRVWLSLHWSFMFLPVLCFELIHWPGLLPLCEQGRVSSRQHIFASIVWLNKLWPGRITFPFLIQPWICQCSSTPSWTISVLITVWIGWLYCSSSSTVSIPHFVARSSASAISKPYSRIWHVPQHCLALM